MRTFSRSAKAESKAFFPPSLSHSINHQLLSEKVVRLGKCQKRAGRKCAALLASRCSYPTHI